MTCGTIVSTLRTCSTRPPWFVVLPFGPLWRAAPRRAPSGVGGVCGLLPSKRAWCVLPRCLSPRAICAPPATVRHGLHGCRQTGLARHGGAGGGLRLGAAGGGLLQPTVPARLPPARGPPLCTQPQVRSTDPQHGCVQEGQMPPYHACTHARIHARTHARGACGHVPT
jgi:hypothetical protein